MLRRLLFAAALLIVLGIQSPAQAQYGFGGMGWGGGFGTNYYGYGLPAGWYTGVQGRLPPYFALHPPVYYSGEIIRIPYGCSPFANPYGPGCCSSMGPAILPAAEPLPEPKSQTINNPFFKPVEVTKAPQRTDLGLMIENPFYQAETKLADSK